MNTTWELVEDSEGVVVHISDAGRKRLSDEGLRRSANDNTLLAQTARTHEATAAAACAGIVVAVVLFAIHTLVS